MKAPERSLSLALHPLRWVALTVAMALACAGLAPARADDPGISTDLEYQVKVAFLYNFAKFVEWPPHLFGDPAAPFTLGILGNDPFCEALERTLQGKSVNGRSIAVRRLRAAEPIHGVQILFISPSVGRDLPRVLAALKGVPVLTVGDRDRFAREGGIINFRIEENKVRFEINLDAAERAGLKVSSKLLTVAHVIREPKGRSD